MFSHIFIWETAFDKTLILSWFLCQKSSGLFDFSAASKHPAKNSCLIPTFTTVSIKLYAFLFFFVALFATSIFLPLAWDVQFESRTAICVEITFRSEYSRAQKISSCVQCVPTETRISNMSACALAFVEWCMEIAMYSSAISFRAGHTHLQVPTHVINTSFNFAISFRIRIPRRFLSGASPASVALGTSTGTGSIWILGTWISRTQWMCLKHGYNMAITW